MNPVDPLYIEAYNRLGHYILCFALNSATCTGGLAVRCPYCGQDDSRVLESRSTDEGSAIRRRRACLACDERFTTYERIETIPLYVIKRDGGREPFNRNKVLGGMLTACQKRPIPFSRLEEVANEIELVLRNRLESEVSTQVIGELVMEALRQIDPVAYIRFASVYRQFDIKRFQQELQEMLRNEPSSTDPS